MAQVFKNPLEQANAISDDSIYFGDSPLWTAATSGNVEYLHNYYKNGGKPNQRFNGFGVQNSLLLGAARNNRPDIVALLESYGEKPLSKEEQDELDEYKYVWNHRGGK